jgi:hypothetical protein
LALIIALTEPAEAKASQFIPGIFQPVYIKPEAKNDAVLVRGVATPNTPIAL